MSAKAPSARRALYRRCLRSVKRIPDADQRYTYEAYVKDGFRSKMHLPSDTRQAVAAVQDAQEQLERMNYFHSIRESKQRDDATNNVDHDKEASINQKGEADGIDASSKQPIQPTSDGGAASLEKEQVVRDWIQQVLPSLYSDDLATYSAHLLDEGFDSVEMLEQELLDTDLLFMKTAHRRVVMRKIRQLSEQDATEKGIDPE